jgi:hypothetical protein
MRTRTYRRADVQWRGHTLVLPSGRVLATVEPHPRWPTAYRARLRSGFESDVLNFTRARDAAVALALAELNQSLVVA